MEGIPAMPTVVEEKPNHNADKRERIAAQLSSACHLFGSQRFEWAGDQE
jgi:hypothetical protein